MVQASWQRKCTVFRLVNISAVIQFVCCGWPLGELKLNFVSLILMTTLFTNSAVGILMTFVTVTTQNGLKR